MEKNWATIYVSYACYLYMRMSASFIILRNLSSGLPNDFEMPQIKLRKWVEMLWTVWKHCCSLGMHTDCRRHTVHFSCVTTLPPSDGHSFTFLSRKIKNDLRLRKYCWQNIPCESCYSAYDAVYLKAVWWILFVNRIQIGMWCVVKIIICSDWTIFRNAPCWIFHYAQCNKHHK